MSIGGKPKRVDTSAFDKQTAEANKRAEEARLKAEEATKKAEEDAKAAQEAQAATQDDIADSNRSRRAAASNRFSLLLFDEDTFGG